MTVPSLLFLLLLSISYVFASLSSHPTVYLIRHGEKSSDPEDDGLNADGFRRAQCLRDVFGPNSGYNVAYIMAPHVTRQGKHRRSYETVLPLAKDLGLAVDTSCKSTNTHCVARKVKKFQGPGNILISWRHSQMKGILRDLGDHQAPEYPEDRFDLIWTVPSPYKNITDVRSEECAELDVLEELMVQV